jgi:hypothetical protein
MNLTNEEKRVLSLLAQAWNQWCDLPNRKPHDDEEFQAAIHSAQNKIAIRVARRVDKDVWAQ